MPRQPSPKLVSAIDDLLKIAIERGYASHHVDDLYKPFSGVANWLHGAIETLDVAIHVCRKFETAITVAMVFEPDEDSSTDYASVSSLKEIERAFDASRAGSPPELCLFAPKYEPPPLNPPSSVRFVAMATLPQIFPNVRWYYQEFTDEWRDTSESIWVLWGPPIPILEV